MKQITCAILLLVAFVGSSYSFDSEQVTYSGSWGNAKEFAREMAKLPTWQPDRDLTSQEWSRLILCAHAMQSWDPRDVEYTLVMYMCEANGDISETWAKPLLILRLMFDLPSTPLKGSFVKSRPPLFGEQVKLSDPIKWTDGKPSLAMFRKPLEWSGNAYQPQFEFRLFREQFKYRDLSGLLRDRK